MRWVLLSVGLAVPLQVSAGGIEGRWIAFDDDDRRPRAEIEIVAHGDGYTGRVLRFMPAPGEDPQPRCTACRGPRAGQLVLGMTILALRRAQADGTFEGTLLDPEEGIEYRCTAVLYAQADELALRGYVGMPLLGRTVTWRRAR